MISLTRCQVFPPVFALPGKHFIEDLLPWGKTSRFSAVYLSVSPKEKACNQIISIQSNRSVQRKNPDKHLFKKHCLFYFVACNWSENHLISSSSQKENNLLHCEWLFHCLAVRKALQSQKIFCSIKKKVFLWCIVNLYLPQLGGRFLCLSKFIMSAWLCFPKDPLQLLFQLASENSLKCSNIKGVGKKFSTWTGQTHNVAQCFAEPYKAHYSRIHEIHEFKVLAI